MGSPSPGRSSSIVERHRRWMLSLTGLLAILGVVIMVASAVSGGSKAPQRGRTLDGAYIDATIQTLADTGELTLLAEGRARRGTLRDLASEMRDRDQLVAQLLASMHMRIFGRAAQGPDGSIVRHDGLSMVPAPAVERARVSTARGFDKSFLDAVIAGRADLLRRARERGRHAEDEQLRSLAGELAATYAADIRRLAAWRERWFGAPPPALRGDAAGGRSSGDMSGMPPTP